MADQNFMDLASKTASGITGTDYMMLVNNSEAYKALVNDVAEAILGKLTSKSFSGLETTAKNVIGALNELNSKILFGENMRYVKVVSNLNFFPTTPIAPPVSIIYRCLISKNNLKISYYYCSCDINWKLSACVCTKI